MLCPVGCAAMKKLHKMKYIIIAVGVIISTAFYVLGGNSDLASGAGGDSFVIGEDAGTEQATADTAGSEGHKGLFGTITGATAGADGGADETEPAAASALTKAEAAESKAVSDLLSDSYADRLDEELYVGSDGRGYLSDTLKAELKACIREAVREELTAICEEGYLEQAVSEAADYAAAEAERKAGLVNINTADAAELMTLDGIGEKRASDIVAYREANGAFATPEDIMQVSGIKQSAYDKIKDRIYAE